MWWLGRVPNRSSGHGPIGQGGGLPSVVYPRVVVAGPVLSEPLIFVACLIVVLLGAADLLFLLGNLVLAVLVVDPDLFVDLVHVVDQVLVNDQVRPQPDAFASSSPT